VVLLYALASANIGYVLVALEVWFWVRG